MQKHFTYLGAAYLFLIEDNKILLQRRCNTGFMDGCYGVPSGHLDGNETARAGCAREMREEIGIEIKPEDLEVVHVMHRNAENDERIDFFTITKTFSGEIKNCEPEKCDDLQWFSLDALPEKMIEYVRIALTHYQNDVTYSEYNY